MVYAPSEQKYMELYSQFKGCAPSVVEYFEQNWHPIRKQWTMGMKYSTGNFLNGTQLLSDRGANLLSGLMQDVCDLLGVKKVNNILPPPDRWSC